MYRYKERLKLFWEVRKDFWWDKDETWDFPSKVMFNYEIYVGRSASDARELELRSRVIFVVNKRDQRYLIKTEDGGSLHNL